MSHVTHNSLIGNFKEFQPMENIEKSRKKKREQKKKFLKKKP